MIQIFRKEISLFFSSITGFIAIAIFLIAAALITFVFPETSVLDYGFATLDSFFNAAPYVLIFLIPAITMKLFAEEKANKTMELLRTKPIQITGIIAGKYLASIVIVLVAILPTIFFAYIVSQLAEPVGNIDLGGFIGSMIGLLFLAFCFCAIGIFGSSISSNQIIAFIVSMFLCFTLYFAFSSLSQLPILAGRLDYFIQELGLESHYLTLSKGLITIKDIVYFLSVILLFLYLTFFQLNTSQQ